VKRRAGLAAKREVALFSGALYALIAFTPRMSSQPKKVGTDLNFESAMERLEAIVEQMESGKVQLEELIARYEEGLKLVKICQERLASAEQRIEMITRTSGGKPVVKDFEPTAEAAPEPEAKKDNAEVRLF
jgi:exodeoxyribonuclease VII small subunit